MGNTRGLMAWDPKNTALRRVLIQLPLARLAGSRRVNKSFLGISASLVDSIQ